MRTDPDIYYEEKRADNFRWLQKWLAVLFCFVVIFGFFFKILFF